ncbi:molybdenum cofactor guanylyltransferase [Corynebacterium uterequi]|uniref:Molybdopterin-guanine dinucleotide biosynthesis protein A n=1 Tax=Corynebacterium uterequi TaxID=1072256 RepID=A0A0G3HFZ9_9CORY|nr:NTP transferase domain-containing protein [Corynebacterium uterequi]AKK10883.1 molybdopterin-guanine dinucleotide biosynthesis protein A [Corynebacterium uterequi]
MTNFTPGLDVIILAGGRGSRMGGRDKATVRVNGERLIDLLLDEVSLLDGLMQVIVVTTRGLDVRPGVKVVAEDPAFAGPVAAIAAGLAAAAGQPSTTTAILAVDAPASAALVPDLIDALDDGDAACVDGQPLCAVWSTPALQQRISDLDSVQDRSARSLLEGQTVYTIDGNGDETDYDTLEELREIGTVD